MATMQETHLSMEYHDGVIQDTPPLVVNLTACPDVGNGGRRLFVSLQPLRPTGEALEPLLMNLILGAEDTAMVLAALSSKNGATTQ